MKTKHLFSVLALVLLMLGGGTSPTWAWKYGSVNCDEDDNGTGTYTFRYDNEYMYYWNADGHKTYLNDGTDGMRWFKTKSYFNADNGNSDCYWWRFAERIVFYDITKRADDNDMKDTQVKGEIYVITADNQSHKIATYEKTRDEITTTKWSMETTVYGDIHVSDVDYDSGHVYVDYWPSNRAIKEGIKQIKFKNCLYFYDNKDRDSGEFQYEKDLDISSLSETNPMKAITFTWNEDANFDLTAKDMKRFSKNDIYEDEYYDYTRYWIRADGKYVSATGKASLNDMKSSETSRDKYKYTGTADWEYTYNSKQYTEGAFTTPVLLKYYRKFEIKPSSDWGFKNFTTQTYNQNNSGEVLDTIQPYTRPESVTLEYDKWDKSITISWTKREKAKCGASSATAFDVDCSTEGKWYVIRYEKGDDPGEYTEVGYKNGSTKTLEMTDKNIQYNKDYVYRVIFLPDVLEDKYANKLTSLPGQAAEHNSNDLWEEENVSSKLEVKINLSQDRTDSTCVHLTWEYVVQTENCEWKVYKRKSGGKTWECLNENEQIPVDTDEYTAEYTATGDVCTWDDYRVMVKVNESECYSNTISANVPAGAYIKEITASKGTEESSVVVKWKVANPGDSQIQYSVLRRQIGEDEWTLLTDDIYGTASEYSYTDTRSQAGSYYEYTIEATGTTCKDQIAQSNDIITPGFSQARGVITGSITYGSGTAVSEVKVNLIKQSDDDDTDKAQYLSRFIEGRGRGLSWTADTTKYENKLTGKNEVTLQMWVRPKAFYAMSYSNFMTLNGGIELGLKTADGENYYLYHTDGSDTIRHTLHNHYDVTFDPGQFTHVAAVYKEGTWTIYTGADSLVKAVSFQAIDASWSAFPEGIARPTFSVGGSYHISNDSTRNFNTGTWKWEPFSGYVDEIRLWGTAIDETKLKKYYNRLLSGKEDGLILYWPLDEGENVVNYAFDYACQDGVYQENHPDVGANAIPRTETPSQLSLYGLTDSDGNYTISGIPFQAGGTSYKVAPSYGVHEFSPTSRTMYVSGTSLTSNGIDFQDTSSFPMTGYCYYAGTNIPVEGLTVYIDGSAQTTTDSAIQTDENGYYEVDVPIGNHYVELKSQDHTLANGGRYPTQGTVYFGSSTTYDFADSTLVTYCGRVSGGEINDTIPVGFAASNNNIGMATIQLKLNNDSYSFNCQDDHITSATTKRTWEGDTTSINSHSWTGTGDYAKYIYIKTDSVTGEFSVKLPPLTYITKSIIVDNNPEVEFTSLPEIDMTFIAYEFSDSLLQANEWGDTVVNYYSYNTKEIFTYRSDPVIEVNQVSIEHDKSAPAGIYGRREIEDHEDAYGTVDITDIWYQDSKTGEYKYKYDYPIYQQADKVGMEVFGYEPYTNYDSGTAITDTIPMNGQQLIVTNEMSDTQNVVIDVEDEDWGYEVGDIYDTKSDTITLDASGYAPFGWQAGTPYTVAPYTRTISMKYERNARPRTWEGFSGIILGTVTKGNNFVTMGPDKVTMILRDCPGAMGQTKWTKGSSNTKYEMEVSKVKGGIKGDVSFTHGVESTSLKGFGKYIKNDTKNTKSFGAGLHYQEDSGYSSVKNYVTTATETVSTSARNDYALAAVTNPSAMGDVFIGTSTNIIIGEVDKVDLYRDSADDNFEVDCRDAIGIGDTATTAFKYTAYEVKNVQIPKWRETRNSMLTFCESKAYADSYVNNGDETLYLCWLDQNSDSLQVDSLTSYRQVSPVSMKDPDPDDVNSCNQQIYTWKQRLAENEKDKVDAMSDSQYFKKNISFDGLAGYSYTSKADTTYQKKHYTNYMIVFNPSGEQQWGGGSAQSWDIDLKITVQLGGTHMSEKSDSTENYENWAEFEYSFQEGHAGSDYTVDIYKSPRGWSDLFVIKAGQSYNPYEGEYWSEYYEPGKHILSYGTTQMEQPDIKISTDGTNPGTSAVQTDVPSGQTAEFTLHMTDKSTTNQGFSFCYLLMPSVTSNLNGLELTMDGQMLDSRTFWINQGETSLKKIQVRQTDQSVLDYEGIMLMLCSSYQMGVINSMVTFDVHFKPSSSDIVLKIDEPTLNNETFNDNDSCLVMKLKDYNRQFKNMKSIGVQYRFAGSTQWTTSHTWVTDEKYLSGTGYSLLDDASEVTYNLNMSSDVSYPEGEYEFRAFTCTPYDNEDIYVYSDVITVTKDLTRPRSLETPDPKNGILGYGDQMAIEFTEDIVPGYVSNTNVVVTAKLNSEETDHEVALALSPYGEQPKTVNPVYLNGSFSMEFWMNWHDAGTILQLGKNDSGTSNFALSIGDDGYVKANIAGAEFTGNLALPKDEWTYFALAYNADYQLFNMLAQYDTENIYVFKDKQVTEEDMQTINYGDDNHLYLGGIDADMHGLALYNIYRDVNDAATEKYQSKDCYVYGLANYWPMDEGHGNTAEDQRHTHDLTVPDSWTIDNLNYALNIENQEGALANMAYVTTGKGDSYAIEMWHKIPAIESIETNPDDDFSGLEQVVFETTSPNVDGVDEQQQQNKLRLYYDTSMNLVLDYGENSQIVASYDNFPEVASWRHLALNVVRGQSASFYLNGERTAVIAESKVPAFEGSKLLLGKGVKNTKIDELRVWHATLSEDFLKSNIYHTLDTAEVYSAGLVAYYPFEKTGEVYGVTTKVETYEDMAPNSGLNGGTVYEVASPGTLSMTSDDCPALKNAEEQTRINTSPVASERKIIINLNTTGISKRQLEGTTLNISVSQVHDLNGNTSNPIRWTALVEQNTLKWKKDSVNIVKEYGTTSLFDVDVENKSGNIEYYTLENLPQWLQPVGSETSDVVMPLKTKTLRFAVDADKIMGVGIYDVTIGLQGNNEIMEPLRIVVKVTVDGPDWAVDPTDYENTMNVVGQVYMNGVLMSNPESRVAAFINGECRGVASLKKMRGSAYVPLTIYGNAYETGQNGEETEKDLNEEITFRIWDASTGTMYSNASVALDGSPIEDMTFDPTKSYGTFDNPVIFTKSSNTEQPLWLGEGWNWLSLNVTPKNTNVSVVFNDVTSWECTLKDMSTGVAYANGSSWSGSMEEVQANTMYKLHLTRLQNSSDLPSPLVVNGTEIDLDENPVTLRKGWNWIAYTPMNTLTLGIALADANPKQGDQVKSQRGFAYYGPYGWEGSLKALENGKGYLYQSTDEETKEFCYPKVSASRKAPLSSPEGDTIDETSKGRSIEAPSGAVGGAFAPTAYPDNMTMVIKLTDGDVAITDAEVAAFIDGECRGAVVADDGLYYLLIAGEGRGQAMELRVALVGNASERYEQGNASERYGLVIDTSLTYRSDGSIGTPWEPYVIDLSDLAVGIRTVAAGSADDNTGWYTVQGIKLDRKPTTTGVYIHNGEKVTIKAKQVSE